MTKKSTLLKDYSDMLNLFEDMQKNHNFKDFDKTIRMQDSHVLVFDSLYYLIENIEDISSDGKIVADLLVFDKFLKSGRLVTLVFRALNLGSDLSGYEVEDFEKVIELGDRDILAFLAKSPYINDEVALKLIKENYQILKNLLENKVLSKELKSQIITFIKSLKEPKKLKKLLEVEY